MEKEPKLIKASEVLKILGICKLTLANYRKKGINLTVYKVGARYYYDEAEVLRYKRGEIVIGQKTNLLD